MKRFIKTFCIILALVCLSACFVSCVSEERKAEIAETIKNAEAADVSEISKYIDALDADCFKKSNAKTNYVMLEISSYGKIVVALRPDVAPISVKNFQSLVADGFYDGLIFHRVIEDFMIQGGGYTRNLKKVTSESITGEFASNGIENDLLHLRGVISMARTNVPDSASSQFFIIHKDSSHLDGDYAAFGYVIAGLDVVDKIASVQTGVNYQMSATNWPTQNVVIKSAYFVSPIVD